MADLLLRVSEKILASLRERAEREQTTVEALAEQILSEPFLELDAGIEYPEWMLPGLFHGGTEVTGRNAEEILRNEMPSKRDDKHAS
jgi:hypothetical protein